MECTAPPVLFYWWLLVSLTLADVRRRPTKDKLVRGVADPNPQITSLHSLALQISPPSSFLLWSLEGWITHLLLGTAEYLSPWNSQSQFILSLDVDEPDWMMEWNRFAKIFIRTGKFIPYKRMVECYNDDDKTWESCLLPFLQIITNSNHAGEWFPRTISCMKNETTIQYYSSQRRQSIRNSGNHGCFELSTATSIYPTPLLGTQWYNVNFDCQSRESNILSASVSWPC